VTAQDAGEDFKMMTQISKKAIAIACGVTALIGAALPASAQDSSMRVKIPFAFVAGKSTLPAGEYRLQVDTNARVLQIQPVTSTNTYSVLLTASRDNRNGKTEDGLLRFQKVDGQYYLGEIWKPTQETGNEVLLPKGIEAQRRSIGTAAAVDVTVK
jgi:hypothetical protein